MPESIDTSLVRIHTKAGSVVGAGFLVSDRHILTCAHVIAQALGLPDDTPEPPSSLVNLDFPRLAPHTLLTAEVVFWCPVQDDDRGDIADLKLLDKPPDSAEAVQFARAEQVWGHDFRAMGFPQGHDDGVWATGHLLGRQGTNWIQLEDVKETGFPVEQGFSGTPVWDMQLQAVVGMVVVAERREKLKTAFVIPVDVLKASWAELVSLMLPLVPRNPYKGLYAFTEHDTRDFFGRELLIDQLATAVETALTCEQKEGRQERLLAVLGPSGSGKSSVVMAGLLPRLRDGGVFNSQEWIYLDPVFPGAHPLEALAVSLAKQLPARSVISLHEDLASASARNLYLLGCQLMTSSQQRVVLIIDQFEELFTLMTDEAERRHFFELLVTALTEPRGPLFVILTLRADFYDRPMYYPDLYRLIDDHHVSVLPIQREDLRKVIEEPANLPDVQLTFERGLVDELLFDMQGQIGALPLLEFTLDQLVERRKGHQLTLQAYREMGSVKGALSQHAEKTYQALPSDEHRQMAREVFLRLVSPGTTEQDTTRRRAARSEFERVDPMQTRRMQETLETFIRARLLTASQINGTTTIEVSHEALIREWKRLAGWLHEAREDIRLQEIISEDATEWEQHNKPGDRLYRGSQLKEAQAWARRNTPSGNEVAFLHAGLRTATAQRIRYVASVTVMVLLLLSTTGLVGWLLTRPDPTRVTNLQDNGTGSLRQTIALASPKSTITFDTSLHGTILLTSDLNITKDLTIRGPLSISSGKNRYCIHVLQGASVTFFGLTFKDSISSPGARMVYAILNEGTLSLSNSNVLRNMGLGGISNSGTLTLTNSIVSGNTSGNLSASAGGITNTGTLTLTNSIVSGNTSNSYTGGGGIFNTGCIERNCDIITLNNSIVSGNIATGGSGGGIKSDSTGTLTLNNSIVSGNTAVSRNTGFQDEGGGIVIFQDNTLTLNNSIVSDNTMTGGSGGGIAGTGMVMLNNSTISGNTATQGDGGGIASGGGTASGGMVMLNNSTISGNIATDGSGGGIYNENGTLTLNNSTVSSNRANSGSGIAISSRNMSTTTPARVMLLYCTVYGNTASIGGGIWVDNTNKKSQVTMRASIVAGNSAHISPNIAGPLTTLGYNLVGDRSGAMFLGSPKMESTDVLGVSFSDLKIDPILRDNGGLTKPHTFTHALLLGSPAIDKIPLQYCQVKDIFNDRSRMYIDQRGIKRPDGNESACDIGAYEYVDSSTTVQEETGRTTP